MATLWTLGETVSDPLPAEPDKSVNTSAVPVNTSSLRHVPDGDGGYLCECPDSECCPEDRPNPLGPHVQVVKGWLDDSGCLLPDPDGIAYRRTFSDWEQVPDGE